MSGSLVPMRDSLAQCFATAYVCIGGSGSEWLGGSLLGFWDFDSTG